MAGLFLVAVRESAKPVRVELGVSGGFKELGLIGNINSAASCKSHGTQSREDYLPVVAGVKPREGVLPSPS